MLKLINFKLSLRIFNLNNLNYFNNININEYYISSIFKFDHKEDLIWKYAKLEIYSISRVWKYYVVNKLW